MKTNCFINVKRLAAGLLGRVTLASIIVTSFISLTLSGVAFAANAGGSNGNTPVTSDGDTAFVNVTETVCGVANGLTGPLGIAIGFCVLVAGLIALQVASRDAVPMIARAAVGTALLLGSSLAFAAILGTTACG